MSTLYPPAPLGSLFAPVSPLSRATDPATSKAAARELVVSGELAERAKYAMGVVQLYPGRTAAELEFNAQCKDGVVRKRLRGLSDAGKIRVGAVRLCGVTERQCLTWWPVVSEEARAAS